MGCRTDEADEGLALSEEPVNLRYPMDAFWVIVDLWGKQPEVDRGNPRARTVRTIGFR
jgi:hypothetical protein